MSAPVLTKEHVAAIHAEELRCMGYDVVKLAESHEALRAERDAALAEVARMREAGLLLLKRSPCNGFNVAHGVMSGCSASTTGATDCPLCGPFRKVQP